MVSTNQGWLLGLLYDSPGKSFTWIGYADHATSDPGSSIADRLTPIIWFRVHDYCTSNDRVLRPLDGNVAHGDLIMGFAIAVCLDIAKVTGVTLLGVGQTVLVTFGVIMPASAHAIGGCAISVLMNVESVLLVWCQPFKVGHHFHGVAVLGKVNYARAVTFGDFIALHYRAWGRCRAKGLVWLAVNARLVEFRGPQRLVFSEEQHADLSFKSNAQ